MAIITTSGFYGGRFIRAGAEVADDLIEAAAPAVATPANPFADMTKAELLAEAERRGVAVKDSDTKAEIIAALEA